LTVIALMIPGRPKGKGRARFAGKGRPPITPKATRAAEREIALAFLASRVGKTRGLMTGTIALTIEAIFKVPKGWNKADRAAALAGEMEYTGKPDRDNIEKLVMDALNGVAWVDDAQVNRGGVVRRYGSPERVEITIEELIAAPGLKSPPERRREAKLASGVPLRPKRKSARPEAPRACELPAIGKRIR